MNVWQRYWFMIILVTTLAACGRDNGVDSDLNALADAARNIEERLTQFVPTPALEDATNPVTARPVPPFARSPTRHEKAPDATPPNQPPQEKSIPEIRDLPGEDANYRKGAPAISANRPLALDFPTVGFGCGNVTVFTANRAFTEMIALDVDRAVIALVPGVAAHFDLSNLPLGIRVHAEQAVNDAAAARLSGVCSHKAYGGASFKIWEAVSGSIVVTLDAESDNPSDSYRVSITLSEVDLRADGLTRTLPSLSLNHVVVGAIMRPLD